MLNDGHSVSEHSTAIGTACCCGTVLEPATSSDDFQHVGNSSEDDDGRAKRRLLIFVNPRSGAGRSKNIFNKQVAPKLVANDIGYDLILTESENHAKSYISSLENFHLYNALVVVSGDGLVFEIVNALLARPEVCDIPIGIVPTGSGNGLLSSVFYYSRYSLKKNEFLNRAINNLCDPQAVAYPVNLMHVETPTESYAATISAGFGLFADIDIESERWRKTLASARFTAGALVRFFRHIIVGCHIAELRTIYSKQLSRSNGAPNSKEFTLVKDTERGTSTLSENLRRHHFRKGIPKITEPIPADWTVIEDDFLFVYALTVSHAGQDVPYTPNAQLFDRNIYLTYALRKDLHKRLDLLKFLSDIKHAKHLNYSFLRIVPVKSFRIEKLEIPKAGGYVTVDGEVINCDILQATNTYKTIPVVTA
ncbi:unnamed protein product [Enterobius vermicularis]|uniref:DAGKc domain-containing protein n=1 Tax=Enterobius vermicularis TaxID=51028 RepID=A0A0N4VMC4_ENTVE|nr:unnamed protein product [Enterobius vermicularis]